MFFLGDGGLEEGVAGGAGGGRGREERRVTVRACGGAGR